MSLKPLMAAGGRKTPKSEETMARLPGSRRDASMAYADIQVEAPEALLTRDAPPEELYRIGLIYSEGMDVAIDLVAAHKWFNIAATRGHRDARICRQEMAEMMTSDEVSKAQRAAREWMKKVN